MACAVARRIWRRNFRRIKREGSREKDQERRIKREGSREKDQE